MSNKPKPQKAPTTQLSPNQTASAVKRNLLWIVIGTAVIAAIAIGIAVILSNSDDKEPPAEFRMPQLDFGIVEITGDFLPEVDERTGVTAAQSFGLRAPVVSGTNYFDEPITIDAAADGPTLVVMLAHWCGVCNNEIPQLNTWRDAGDVPEWLNVVGVGSAVNADMPNFPPGLWLQQKDWTWPVLADVDFETDYANSVTRAFGSGGYPGFVLIDGNGVVVWKHNGAIGVDNLNQVIAAAFPNGADAAVPTPAPAVTTTLAGTTTTVAGDTADSTTPSSTAA